MTNSKQDKKNIIEMKVHKKKINTQMPLKNKQL